MTRTAVEMGVSNFKELTALISLYRPGPMDYIPTYIRNKENPESIAVPFEELRDILSETYGVLVYQEQVMQMVQAISGYSMADADSMRKAIGKKKEKLIEEHRRLFVEGINKDGEKVISGGVAKYDKRALEDYYDNTIVPFGKYAFNKSHAASYARIGVMMGYLKLHYPVEFMAESIEALYKKGSTDKLKATRKRYFDYCKERKIEVEPPDINRSEADFKPTKNGAVVFGLRAIKGVGKGAETLVREREKNGLFMGPADFLNRAARTTGINRSAVESLIKAGGLDSFGVKRSEALAAFDDFLAVVAKRKQRKNKDSLPLLTDEDIPVLREFPTTAILRGEMESAGKYLSGHPLDRFSASIKTNSHVFSSFTSSAETEAEEEIEARRLSNLDGQRYDGTMLITGVTEVVTKKDKKLMAFLDVDDTYSVTRVVMFHRTYMEYKDTLAPGTVVRVRGRINLREGEISLIPDNLLLLDQKDEKDPVVVVLSTKDLAKVKEITEKYRGDYPVILKRNGVSIPLPRKHWVSIDGGHILRETFRKDDQHGDTGRN